MADTPYKTALDQFLASVEAYDDFSSWAVPNGRLYRLFSGRGFAISSVRDLRAEVSDYDIDGEVTMLVPRTRLDVTLRRNDFTLVFHYQLWDFRGILSPQQLARAGGATELHLKVEAQPLDIFAFWLGQAAPLAISSGL